MSYKLASINKNVKYQNAMYVRRQMRDTIAGPNEVKKSGEMYLPIPSSWLGATQDIPSYQSSVNSRGPVMKISPDYLPWWHPNPMYRAYLQRARFPDITAAALRGMMGIAVKSPNKIELPSSMQYLIEAVAPGGESLEEFFGYCLSEVLSVGNVNIVADVANNEFFLTTYTAESTVDWVTVRKRGAFIIKEITFIEVEDYFDERLDCAERCYYVEDGIVKLKSKGDVEFEDEGDSESEDAEIITELNYRGKKFDVVPVFPAGSVDNVPDPQIIPLQGISDISISIYQMTADLRQAQYLTCNPTLFVFGATDKELPDVIGSGVMVGIKNAQGQAMYPATDTSALDHIREDINDMKKEAASYGANFIIGNQRESGEALGIKKAGQGANLVRVVKQVGKAVESALKFIARMKGHDDSKVIYEPNVEFAEMYLTAQDLSTLVSSWIQGAIDQDTLLDNMRDAGIIKKDKTNEDVKNAIETQPPAYTPRTDPKGKTDEKDDETKKKDQLSEEDEADGDEE